MRSFGDPLVDSAVQALDATDRATRGDCARLLASTRGDLAQRGQTLRLADVLSALDDLETRIRRGDR